MPTAADRKNILETAHAVTQSTFLNGDGPPHERIIILAGGKTVHASNFPVIAQAIQNRRAT